jgi:hypothetical protein
MQKFLLRKDYIVYRFPSSKNSLYILPILLTIFLVSEEISVGRSY